MLIDREALCAMIPHGNGLCLLDGVTYWDAEKIVCRAGSHQRPDHPLRSGGGLSTLCALEYGAQAMAVHGALLAREQGGQVRRGWLASVREARFATPRLNTLEAPLEIQAVALSAGNGGAWYGRGSGFSGGIVYDVAISNGAREIVAARIMIALSA